MASTMYNKEHGKTMPDPVVWLTGTEIVSDLCKYQWPLQIYASISYGKRKELTRSF